MEENKVNEAFKDKKASVGDILTPEDKSTLRNFAQKVHRMDINDVGRLHNGYADALNSEQKDIVAFELKMREYQMYKDHGIDPKVAFSPENIRKVPEYTNDKTSIGFIMKEREFNSEMSDELLERSKQIIENTYIPIDATKLHEKDGGGINAMYNKIVAIDDNGNRIKVNNRGIQEGFRKNYLYKLSQETGIDYTKIDEGFYDSFTPMSTPDAEAFQNKNDTVYDKVNSVDSIDMSDYEDDDDDF